jgi:hypothetical protein
MTFLGAWDPNKVYWGEFVDDHGTPHEGGADSVSYQGAIWIANYYNSGWNPIADIPGDSGAWKLASGSTPVYDQVAPEAPEGLTAGYTSSTSIALFWNAAEVNGIGDVTGYDVYQDGVKIGTTTSTSFMVKGLDASTSYSFTVDAIDVTGTSDQSDALTASTHGEELLSSKYYSPFVDMTLPTTDLVELSRDSGLSSFTLAFMQASKSQMDGTGADAHLIQGETPTLGWGGLTATTLPTGVIVDEVKQVEALGGEVTISLGGYTGRDVAVVAEQYAENLQEGSQHLSAAAAEKAAVANLQTEYQSVINTYGVTHLDFDIENDTISGDSADLYQVVNDTEANHIRDLAIKKLEAANPDLDITFTVATTPDGLADDASSAGGDVLAMLQLAKQDGVKIDVVNIMAMDYFSGVDHPDMGQMAIDAAKAVHKQLQSIGMGNVKIGITPMIGQNDNWQNPDTSEVFTLADARKVEAFAAATPWVAGMGAWELPRDTESTEDTTNSLPTSTSSGVIQDAWEFSSIFDKITRLATDGNDLINGDSKKNKLYGLDGNDHINGGAGKDILDGMAGKDTLKGGAGNDQFVFDTALSAANRDKIEDFSHDHDRIVLSKSVFGAIGPSLTNDEFAVVSSGHNAADHDIHIIYNKTDGTLWYDADGKGGAGAVEFATFDHKPSTLDIGDFHMIA